MTDHLKSSNQASRRSSTGGEMSDKVTVDCPECFGTGEIGVGCAINRPAMMTSCLRCNGRGTIPASQPENRHIMLRCPHCNQEYEAEIGNNPLIRDGLFIKPLPIEIPVESEIEQ
jgi:DnaJ-class molecular chaperone